MNALSRILLPPATAALFASLLWCVATPRASALTAIARTPPAGLSVGGQIDLILVGGQGGGALAAFCLGKRRGEARRGKERG